MALIRQLFEMTAFQDRLKEEVNRHTHYIDAYVCNNLHRLEELSSRLSMFYRGSLEALINFGRVDEGNSIDSDWEIRNVLVAEAKTSAPLDAQGYCQTLNSMSSWVQLGINDSAIASGIMTELYRSYLEAHKSFKIGLVYLTTLSPLRAQFYRSKLSQQSLLDSDEIEGMDIESAGMDYEVDDKFQDDELEDHGLLSSPDHTSTVDRDSSDSEIPNNDESDDIND